MNNFKVTYKFKIKSGWQIGYRCIQANSKEDAIKKMDMWPPLILKVERL
jgi:hypothetical protein